MEGGGNSLADRLSTTRMLCVPLSMTVENIKFPSTREPPPNLSLKFMPALGPWKKTIMFRIQV